MSRSYLNNANPIPVPAWDRLDLMAALLKDFLAMKDDFNSHFPAKTMVRRGGRVRVGLVVMRKLGSRPRSLVANPAPPRPAPPAFSLHRSGLLCIPLPKLPAASSFSGRRLRLRCWSRGSSPSSSWRRQGSASVWCPGNDETKLRRGRGKVHQSQGRWVWGWSDLQMAYHSGSYPSHKDLDPQAVAVH